CRLVESAGADHIGPMCGRYTYKLSWEQIVSLYRLTLPNAAPADLRPPSYNVAPTDLMPIIRPAGNGRELVVAKWGLVPYWTKPDQAAKPPYATINARADRVQTAPAYREPFKSRRFHLELSCPFPAVFGIGAAFSAAEAALPSSHH